MYKKIFKSILKSSKLNLGGLYKSESNAVMARKPHFIFSAENPMYPENHIYNLKHEQVVSLLKKKGYQVEEARGHYGKPERSIIVHNTNPNAVKHLQGLARGLGQESSIASDGYNHEMHFHGGENEGLHIKGQGTTIHKRKPDDFFTEMKDGTSFSHVFNFDESHPKESSAFNPPKLSTKKSEVNFIKSEPNHPLVNPHPDTKLIHFSQTQGLKEIDPNFQGKRITDASSKRGKPEHPVSFYYLEGAKPEALVAHGSTSKYVARLGHKKVYDLGTDPDHIKHDLREAAKNRQINPGSFTRDELDAAIKAKGYHGIYNSAHEVEDMRKVVGMYHAMPVEKEVPFHPKDAEIATDAAHEQHHSVLKSEDNAFDAKMKRIDFIRKTTKPKKMKISLEHLHQDPLGVSNAHKTFHFEPNFQVSSKPVKVGVHTKTGKMYLLDGYHRALAAQKRGDTHIVAHVIPTKGVLGAKHPKYNKPGYEAYKDQFFHEPATWDEVQQPKQTNKIAKNSRRLLIDDTELQNIEKAGVGSPSKFTGVKRLKQIQTDNGIGEGGKEYDMDELKNSINERSQSVANKMVQNAGKQEKQRAIDAENEAKGIGGALPSMMPPSMPKKPGIGGTISPIAQHNPNVRAVADSYAATRGIKLNHNIPASKVDPKNAAKIADAYHQAQHTPNDPHVKSAYDALIGETKAQYQHMLNNGLKVTKMQPNQPNPYKTSKDLFNDIKNNNHIAYFPTDQGYGSGDQVSDHPMLQATEHMDAEGKPMLANDIFRVVHDYFGHAKEGNGFGANGEEGAWKHHMQMYSPMAQKALTAETRGQNSWVNYGPHGETNRANPANTKYADQKATILPDWAHQHGEQSVYSSLKKGEHGDWKQEGYKLNISEPFEHRDGREYTVDVISPTGTEAGYFHFNHYNNHPVHGNKIHVMDANVFGNHKRKGIASSVYRMMEEHTGAKIHQEPTQQTSAAKKLWSNPNRSFGLKKREVIMMKGAMQRIAPYNPDKHISAEDHSATENWTKEGDDQDARSKVPEMHANAKIRALHKMTGLTQVRKHPKTGERMFLLHRGMDSNEQAQNHKGGVSNYAPGTMTSWTPHYKVAQGFSTDHQSDLSQKPKIVSAWIPESHIHNIPNQTMIPDENTQFRNEHEVIVNHQGPHPHAHPDIVAQAKNPRLYLDNKINMKGLAEQAQKQPFNMEQALQERTKRTIRAEEYKRNKFGKREVISMKTLAKGDISSKIKNGVAGLAVAAAAMSPMNSIDDKQTLDKPAITQQAPAPINKRKERILSSIMDVESSGGKNTNHKAMPKDHKLHMGERAYGSYGLMPLVIRETIKKNPTLNAHAAAQHLIGDKMHEYMRKNPTLEKQVAEAHYDRLAKQFGDNPQKIGYAWLNGVAGTYKALKEKRPLDKHFYVKKILKAYGTKKQGLK